MKTTLLWLFLSLLTLGARAQVQLGQETFEGVTSDVGYTTSTPFAAVYLDPPSNTVASEYFQRINQVAGQPYTPWSSSSATLGNQQGSYFWGAEGVRGGNNIAVRPAGFVQLNSINTSLYNNLKITVAFSAPRGAGYPGTFGVKGVKRQDQVLIQYSFDGTNFTNAGRLTGDDPTPTNSGRWKRDVNMSGDASDDTTEPILNMNFTDYQFDVAAIGSQLWVRIVADYADITASELAFDNIRVSGTVDNTPRPVLALDASESGPISYTEGDPAVPITNTLAVSYPGGGTTLTGATVQIVSGYVPSQDVLSFSAQNGISASSNANGTLTLTGTTSLAYYQAALRSITYQNTNGTTATGGARAIGFTVRNGSYASNTPTRTINVTAVLNAPAPLPYTEDLETDGEGTRYTASTFASSATQTGFFRATASPPVGPGGVTLTNSTFTGYNGSGYWFGRGTRSITNPTYPVSTLQLAPVNATNTINLRFTLRLGRGQGSQTSGWEPDDYIKFFYRTSSTGNWVLFGAFYGDYTTGEARRDTNLDGQPDANGTLLTSTMQDVVFGTNNEIPNSAAVAALDFKIETASDDEEVVFDYIRISATTPPAVTTAAPTSITGSSAALGGQVTSDGGSPVTARGVVYSTTNTTPTIGAAGVTQDPNSTTGTGSFAETISGLPAATTYYVRAYATNALGTTYGAVQSFSTQTTVVSIVRASPNPTNSAAVSYTVTFGGSVSGLTASNFSLTTNGLARSALGAVTGSGTTYSVVVYPGVGDGTLVLNLANATGISPGISTPLPFAGETYTIDHTAPTITSVGVPANGTYGVGAALTFTVNFSEAVTVNTTGGTPSIGLTVGSATRAATYVAGSGTTALQFRYTVVSGDQAPNGIGINAYYYLNGGIIQDVATNSASGTFNSVPSTSGVLVDGVAPTVTAFSGPVASGGTTATSPLAFSVSFSKSVTNFLAGGITVTNGSVTSGPTGIGTGPYTFSVTPTTAGTATTVTIAANAAKDAAGNGNTASSIYSLTYLPPTAVVSAVTGITPSPTATAQVSYAVTFSASLSGLTTGNFDLTTTGLSGAGVASVSGSGRTYTVVVNTGTGNGTLRLNVANSTGLTPTVTGLPYTSGTVYTLTKSFPAAPTLRIQAAGSASGNGDVTAFVDVVQVLSGGTAFANGLQNGSFESNNVPAGSFRKATDATPVVAAPWAFTGKAGVTRTDNGTGFNPPTPPDGDAVGLVQSAGDNNASISQNLAVPTGSYQINFQTAQRNYTSRDQRLNVFVNDVFVGNIQPIVYTRYEPFTSATFSVTAPALIATVSTTSASPTSTAPIPFSVSFTAGSTPQSVGTTFTASDVTVTGGTLNAASFSGSGAGPYTFTVTPSGPGPVSVSVAANVAFDANNTGNTGSTPVSVQYQVPSCAITARSQNVNVTLGADGTASVAASAVDNGSSSPCGAVTLSVSPSTFTCANLGANSVTLTVQASDGTLATATATVTVSVPALASTTWTGTVSTDWSDCRNWSYGLVPTASLSALVPAGLPRYPSLTAGPYAVSSLSIASGASLTTTASATLQLSGNFNNDGTATLAGPVQLVGTPNQTLGGQASMAFGLLTVAKPAGTVVQLQRDLLIGTSLTLNGGTLATASYRVVLGSSATLSETDASYVLGNVAVTRTLAPGTAESFGGLGLTLTPAAGSLAPGLTAVVRTTGTVLLGVGTSQSIKRYFDIQPAVDQGLNVDLTFGYFAHELNNIAATNLLVFKSATTAGPWQNQGQRGRTADAATASGTVSLTGISSFSIWTLGDVANPLPVTLTSFTATASGAGSSATVRLAWATASEVNSKAFEVERSLEGVTFTKLGEVAAAGTSSQAHPYALTDSALPAGASLLYYRLRQVDQDGMAHYSVVRSVALSAASLSLYPNPTHERAVTLLGAQPGLRVLVLDAVGRQVLSASVPATGTTLLALPPECAAGVYMVLTGSQALRLTVE